MAPGSFLTKFKDYQIQTIMSTKCTDEVLSNDIIKNSFFWSLIFEEILYKSLLSHVFLPK